MRAQVQCSYTAHAALQPSGVRMPSHHQQQHAIPVPGFTAFPTPFIGMLSNAPAFFASQLESHPIAVGSQEAGGQQAGAEGGPHQAHQVEWPRWKGAGTCCAAQLWNS